MYEYVRIITYLCIFIDIYFYIITFILLYPALRLAILLLSQKRLSARCSSKVALALFVLIPSNCLSIYHAMHVCAIKLYE